MVPSKAALISAFSAKAKGSHSIQDSPRITMSCSPKSFSPLLKSTSPNLMKTITKIRFVHCLAGVLFSASLHHPPAFAQRYWQKCVFNARIEDCEFAGSSSSFTITYRSDGKQIQVEKVGASHECGDGSSHECGKMLITEPKERRTTWATYRQTPNAIIIRSSRGNIYNIPY